MLFCRVGLSSFGLFACSSILSPMHRFLPSGIWYLQRGLEMSELNKLPGFFSCALLGLFLMKELVYCSPF